MRRLDVGRNAVSRGVCPVADGLDHLRRHLHFTRDALFLRVHHATRDHQLDEVDALRLCGIQLRERLRNRVRGHGDRPGHMSARDGDPLVGGQDPRPYAAARRDLISQPRVKIDKTADRADGRDAAHQLCPGKAADHLIGDLPRQRRGEDRADQLFVVPLLFLRLAAACKMDMHVDQARHQIPALQVDDGIAVKRRPLRDDGADALSVRQDAESFLHLHVLRAVQELSVRECVFHRISLTFLLYSIACCADPVKPQRAESVQKNSGPEENRRRRPGKQIDRRPRQDYDRTRSGGFSGRADHITFKRGTF